MEEEEDLFVFNDTIEGPRTPLEECFPFEGPFSRKGFWKNPFLLKGPSNALKVLPQTLMIAVHAG
jgi:hypothetical protein